MMLRVSVIFKLRILKDFEGLLKDVLMISIQDPRAFLKDVLRVSIIFKLMILKDFERLLKDVLMISTKDFKAYISMATHVYSHQKKLEL